MMIMMMNTGVDDDDDDDDDEDDDGDDHAVDDAGYDDTSLASFHSMLGYLKSPEQGVIAVLLRLS